MRRSAHPTEPTGSIMDVQHVVILMQENRSFDHYFGTLRGVRGFGDRFPIPLAGGRTVWEQRNGQPQAATPLVAPFHLDTVMTFGHMRVTGTPHTWPDAQRAWDNGRMEAWPTFKQAHAMAYYTQADLPYQFALADMFTVCDAYHSALQAGTNPNRVMAWTGTIDPFQRGHGPVIGNSYDHLGFDPQGGYAWTTYLERLQAAGVSWQVYQDMADNYADNPLAGFRTYRHAHANTRPGDPEQTALRRHGLSTRTLAQLKQDVLDGALPQVSYIVATAEGSEHPVPSSPAQGAAYTAAVIDALCSDLEVWRGTVLFVMFDENDGFFDHMPPPAVPACLAWHGDPAQDRYAGASTVTTDGEYHRFSSGEATDVPDLLQRPYGLGPRVPMYVVSPWSRGGWVNSEVFDHTSVIRFLERRFGVMEPNISPWRRAVCGDLTGAFDFSRPDPRPFAHELPETQTLAQRARALPRTSTPATPAAVAVPVQQPGTRPSRALPYVLEVTSTALAGTVTLAFRNHGQAAAVFHVYDRLRLDQWPRRYTVEPGLMLAGEWARAGDGYDLWVLGPNGFHRSMRSRTDNPVTVHAATAGEQFSLLLHNRGKVPAAVVIQANAYRDDAPMPMALAPGEQAQPAWNVAASGHWYDFSVTSGDAVWRFAGRIETGKDSISDPAAGPAGVAESVR